MYDYMIDENRRVIRIGFKEKNGTSKIMFTPMVPVTKNIHDFVPL